MARSRERLALGVAFIFPLISVATLSVPPWQDWFPEARNVGLPWLYVTTAFSSIGIILLPWPILKKLVALALYVPAMLLLLIGLTVSVTCLAQGPHACP